MSIVIHDNPDCGTSRNVLAIIEGVVRVNPHCSPCCE
jgi:arsenate reductase-like glutaredoxin family protein